MKKHLIILAFALGLFGFIFFSHIVRVQAATLYYNNATADGDWNTLGNWWTDAGFTTPAGSLPTASDDAIIEGVVASNSGAPASVNTLTVNTFYTAIPITVANGATFNDSSFNSSGGNIIGNATFNNSTYNDGGVGGDATFNDGTYNRNTVTGNAIFNDSSFNDGSCDPTCGTVNNNATFNDIAHNEGFVLNNASFYDITVNHRSITNDACFALTADQDGGTVGGTITVCPASSPTVVTTSSTILSTSSAQLFGELTNTGGEAASEIGFQYGTTTGYGSTANQTGTFLPQTFDNVVGSLPCGPIHFRAYAVNSAGTGLGSDLTFTATTCSHSGGGGGRIIRPTVTPPPTLIQVNCPHFVTYHKRGERSDAIKSIQDFLQKQNFDPGPADGFFSQKTFDAVKAFQLKYFDEVLKPWNLPAPTGRWYESTRFKANELFGCSEGSVILDNGVEIR